MLRHLPGGHVVVCVTVAMVTRDVIYVTSVLGTAREIPLCPSLKHIHVKNIYGHTILEGCVWF